MADADDGPLGEARKFYRPREKLRWPVVVAPLLPGGEPAGSTLATTRGISVGGAFIESDGVFAVGTALHLWLHPPTAPAVSGLPSVLRMRAEVRWINDGTKRDLPRGFGVEFRALTAADEIALHAYFSRAYKVV